jgi:hypothetical protein
MQETSSTRGQRVPPRASRPRCARPGCGARSRRTVRAAWTARAARTATDLTAIVALSGLAGLALPPVPARADYDQHVSLKGESLLLVNLAGSVTILPNDGPAFEVDVAVRGKDGTRETVRIETSDGPQAKLVLRYPLDKEDRFVYPPMGHGSTTVFEHSRGDHEKQEWVRELFGGERGHRVRVTGRGAGTEAYADLTVRVPRGSKLQTGLAVGGYQVDGVEADLTLFSMSGDATLRRVRGGVRVDTGSGDVELSDVTGDISVDTGSGDVEIAKVSGSLSVDTGSGDLELALTRMGDGRYELDTGSGEILLRVPSDASARVEASTGSGSIHLDVNDAVVERLKEDEATFQLGDGRAQVRLQTGSGSIRIAR